MSTKAFYDGNKERNGRITSEWDVRRCGLILYEIFKKSTKKVIRQIFNNLGQSFIFTVNKYYPLIFQISSYYSRGYQGTARFEFGFEKYDGSRLQGRLDIEYVSLPSVP